MIITINWVFFGVAVAVVVVAVFVFWLAIFRRRHVFTPAEIISLSKRFSDLEKKMHWDPRFVLLELDKLLYLLLKKKGYRGSTGDKLKAYGRAARRGAHVQELWDMHKLRNRVAHEMDVEISVPEARRAWRSCISAYRDAGVDIKIL